MRKKSIFIISYPRGASTAVVNLCNLSTNGKFYSENAPQLCMESRDLYEKTLIDPVSVIKKAKLNLIKEMINSDFIIGDKNPNYLLFSKYLVELWDAKILFLVKDVREVVKSVVNWHNFNNSIGKGGFFDLAEDNHLSLKTFKQDWWDYSRLRPSPSRYPEDKSIAEVWKDIERPEKISWSWNRFNKILFDLHESLPSDNTMLLNTTNMSSNSIEEVYDFLALTGFDQKEVNHQINRKVNTVAVKANKLPIVERTVELDAQSMKYSGEMMRKLNLI